MGKKSLCRPHLKDLTSASTSLQAFFFCRKKLGVSSALDGYKSGFLSFFFFFLNKRSKGK